MTDELKSFGDRLRSLMKDMENQGDFSKRIGLKQAQLNRYLNNKKIPRHEVAERIAASLGVSPAWLLYGEGDPSPAPRSPLLVPASPGPLDPEARQLGARITRPMTDRDRIEMAVSWLRDLDGLSHEEREILAELVRQAAADRDFLAILCHHARFIQWEKIKKNP